MLQNLTDILAAPGAVFARLKEKPTILFPLLLVIVALASIQVGYMLLMDFSFIVDQSVDQVAAGNPNVDPDQLREQLGRQNPLILAIPGMVLIPVVILLVNTLYAAYLNFVSKFGLEEYGFRHWFSLLCWTGVPTVFTAIAAWAVMLSSSNGQVPQADLQPLSLDALLALDSGTLLLQNLSLPQFWSLGLLVYGYHHFTGKSLAGSALIALMPSILFYGAWALIALL